jgi:hypothetical protein
MIHNREMKKQIWYHNQQIHIRVSKYIIHNVYLLHVSATHVANFRDVYYKRQVNSNITEVILSMYFKPRIIFTI